MKLHLANKSLICISLRTFLVVLLLEKSRKKLGIDTGLLEVVAFRESCPVMEGTIYSAIKTILQTDASILPKLLRLHFHDCFVQGCDASVLLDQDLNNQTEKDIIPNKNSIAGFEAVDEIKKAVEKACPGVVSCADILALSAQISVGLAGGPQWKVPMGRKDSRHAFPNEVQKSIPLANDPLESLRAKFMFWNLSEVDLVALSGAHSIGQARCLVFEERLANFSFTGKPDPTLDPVFRATLQQICQNPNATHSLDQRTPSVFDNSYYHNLQHQGGLLQSDQELFSTQGADTPASVQRFAEDELAFFTAFAQSMIKMGNLVPGQSVGRDWEIRSECRRVNQS